jgi:hypothetical protein
MPVNLTEIGEQLEDTETTDILALIDLCRAELANEDREIPQNYGDETMRGGIRPTRPSL